jgi:hypothetical protein
LLLLDFDLPEFPFLILGTAPITFAHIPVEDFNPRSGRSVADARSLRRTAIGLHFVRVYNTSPGSSRRLATALRIVIPAISSASGNHAKRGGCGQRWKQ